MQTSEGELITVEELREMFNRRRSAGERVKMWLQDRLTHITHRHFGTLIEAREASQIARMCGLGSRVENCTCGKWILRLGSGK